MTKQGEQIAEDPSGEKNLTLSARGFDSLSSPPPRVFHIFPPHGALPCLALQNAVKTAVLLE
jgi:hypothetical protein